MILAIGRAIAANQEPPRRSIMLLFVGAEESGLLGSKFFASHPTVAPGKIAANINIDSANIWGETRNITLIGLGKSSLDTVAKTVLDRQGRVLEGDHFPDRGYFYRSDQFSFARIGVPALYFNTGTDFVGRPEGWGEEQINGYTQVNYHQPTDTLGDDWNFAGMIQDAHLNYWAGLIIANDPALPSWTPGDEFEAARKGAIEALEVRP
jgi:Zn-dependent M28 family amino/carboxypeptidase